MLESRPEDVLVKLVKTVETVKTMETVGRDCSGCRDWRSEKNDLDSSDNLKARDAGASKRTIWFLMSISKCLLVIKNSVAMVEWCAARQKHRIEIVLLILSVVDCGVLNLVTWSRYFLIRKISSRDWFQSFIKFEDYAAHSFGSLVFSTHWPAPARQPKRNIEKKEI